MSQDIVNLEVNGVAVQGRKGQSKLEEDRAQALESGALHK